MTSTRKVMAALPPQWCRMEPVRNASDIRCAVDDLPFSPISVNCFILECSGFREAGRRDRGGAGENTTNLQAWDHQKYLEQKQSNNYKCYIPIMGDGCSAVTQDMV